MSFASFMLTSDCRRQPDAIEDSRGTRVASEFEEQRGVTSLVADKDSSRATSSKQEGSVVSAILAAACIAAVGFEAVAESQRKELGNDTAVKGGDRDRIVTDRDSSIGRGPVGAIENNQTSGIEKIVVVDRTTKESTVIGSLPRSTTPTPATTALSEARVQGYRSARYIQKSFFLQYTLTCP